LCGKGGKCAVSVTVLLGISTLPPGTFGDSHFTARWTKKGRFPTLQLSLKTKISVQA